MCRPSFMAAVHRCKKEFFIQEELKYLQLEDELPETNAVLDFISFYLI